MPICKARAADVSVYGATTVSMPKDKPLIWMAEKVCLSKEKGMDNRVATSTTSKEGLNYVQEIDSLREISHGYQQEKETSSVGRTSAGSTLSEVTVFSGEENYKILKTRSKDSTSEIKISEVLRVIDKSITTLRDVQSTKHFKVVSTTSALIGDQLKQGYEESRLKYYQKIATCSGMLKAALKSYKQQTGSCLLTQLS